MLSSLLQELQDAITKTALLPIYTPVGLNNEGDILERKIADKLIDYEFSELEKERYNTTRKRQIKDHLKSYEKENYFDIKDNERKSFLHQPFGSQEYPDFLIFTNNKVIPLEIKFSKNKKLMWNSGLPRQNGFYIFASNGTMDITFFQGKSVISRERTKLLINFFTEIKKLEKEFNNSLKAQSDDERRGFMVYVRKAYDQKKTNVSELNYFTHPHRLRIEGEMIELIQGLEQ